MGKSTISMVIFNSYVTNYQRVKIVILILDGGDWNMWIISPFSWDFHHPNWLAHIFQRGRSTTNQYINGKNKHQSRAFRERVPLIQSLEMTIWSKLWRVRLAEATWRMNVGNKSSRNWPMIIASEKHVSIKTTLVTSRKKITIPNNIALGVLGRSCMEDTRTIITYQYLYCENLHIADRISIMKVSMQIYGSFLKWGLPLSHPFK